MGDIEKRLAGHQVNHPFFSGKVLLDNAVRVQGNCRAVGKGNDPRFPDFRGEVPSIFGREGPVIIDGRNGGERHERGSRRRDPEAGEKTCAICRQAAEQ